MVNGSLGGGGLGLWGGSLLGAYLGPSLGVGASAHCARLAGFWVVVNAHCPHLRN